MELRIKVSAIFSLTLPAADTNITTVHHKALSLEFHRKRGHTKISNTG